MEAGREAEREAKRIRRRLNSFLFQPSMPEFLHRVHPIARLRLVSSCRRRRTPRLAKYLPHAGD